MMDDDMGNHCFVCAKLYWLPGRGVAVIAVSGAKR